MIDSANPRSVQRGFVAVGDREVHYRRVGHGPPALFIHSSPTNSAYVLPDMMAQADRYTCLAFDTPGFGLSDPLPGDVLSVADLADATAAAMTALDLGPVPVFGTHSGAAIALELGYRHPARVTGLVLDGVPIFTRGEVEALGERYFKPLAIDALGGHFSSTWTRFRDQYRWFPWFARHPDAINDTDLGSPEAVHGWVEMFFAASAHYRPAYRAVTSYCEDAIAAAAGLLVPAYFTATPTDMLHPHLKRLPQLRPDQRIVEIGEGTGGKQALVRRAFAAFGAPSFDSSGHMLSLRCDGRLRRQFLTADGRPLLIRYAGQEGAEPLVLLHDAPGSSRMLEHEIVALSRDHLVIAPDIPGSGDSAGMPAGAELADYAGVIWAACDQLGLKSVAIHGRGLGASLALGMATAQQERMAALGIDSLFLPDPEERRTLRARYAPPIVIERDGAHWYRLWLQLRDSLIYWPWFDTQAAAARREAADFDANLLHDWTCEVMKQWQTHHHFIQAALRDDASAALARLQTPVRMLPNALSPFASAYGERLKTLLHNTATSISEGVPA